jgi:DNA polymerase-3 subunit alpha
VYLAECRNLGIQVLVPDVNVSASDFIARAETIPFGMSAIRNVGEGLVARIVEERETGGSFVDFYDFCERVDPMVLNKRSVESLIKGGGFDSLGHPRKGLLLVFEQIVDSVLARRREKELGIMNLFGDLDAADGAGPIHDERVAIPDDEFDKSQRLAFEKEMLGLYVSDHPLMGVEGALGRHTDCSISALRELRDGETRWVGGVVTALQRKYTKRGELMAVFVLEDLEAAMEVMVFPRTMHEYGPLLDDDAIVCVKGRVDLREEPAKIICLELKRPELVADHNSALHVNLPATRVTGSLIEDLKRVLLEHSGTAPVFLHLGQKVLRLPDGFNVATGNGLLAELRVLLGPNGLLS